MNDPDKLTRLIQCSYSTVKSILPFVPTPVAVIVASNLSDNWLVFIANEMPPKKVAEVAEKLPINRLIELISNVDDSLLIKLLPFMNKDLVAELIPEIPTERQIRVFDKLTNQDFILYYQTYPKADQLINSLPSQVQLKVNERKKSLHI